jgi:ectoine hydroxylase-related dioxygenase (phytanoyl-CoA dioxygenase family)
VSLGSAEDNSNSTKTFGPNPVPGLRATWFIDAFTSSNGATRVVPGSHRQTDLVGTQSRYSATPCPGETLTVGSAGTLLVSDAFLWHAGTVNSSGERRRSIQLLLSRADLPTFDGLPAWPM